MEPSDASGVAPEALVKSEDNSDGSQSTDPESIDADTQQAVRRSSEDARQAEDAAERAERRIYEAEVLERAHAIEKARAATTKASAESFALRGTPLVRSYLTPQSSRSSCVHGAWPK